MKNDARIQVKNCSDTIDFQLKNITNETKGFIAQNLFKPVRDLMEGLLYLTYEKDNSEILEMTSENLKIVKPYCKKKQNKSKEFQTVLELYSFIQEVYHISMNPDESCRLMDKYFSLLVSAKIYCKVELEIDILQNLTKYPFQMTHEYEEYYRQINHALHECLDSDFDYLYNIISQHLRYIDGRYFYELNVVPANDNTSKFDRLVVFSKTSFKDNYSVYLSIKRMSIPVAGDHLPIHIVHEGRTYIRPASFNMLAKVFDMKNTKISKIQHVYRYLMQFIQVNGADLDIICSLKREDFKLLESKCTGDGKYSDKLFRLLNRCRRIINKNKPGSNLLRYLLHTMRVREIQDQLDKNENVNLSNLFFKNGCIPFEKMPFATSLKGHNPSVYDLLNCIDKFDREHEFLAREMVFKCKEKRQVYLKKDDILESDKIEELSEKFNSHLYYKHENRKIIIEDSYLYIQGEEVRLHNILKALKNYSNSTNSLDFKSNVKDSINKEKFGELDDYKKENLPKVFDGTNLCMIYGTAGSGKTTMLKYILPSLPHLNVLCVSVTQASVQNLRNKLDDKNKVCTIKSALKNSFPAIDVLVIDECSTVSNKDMNDLLTKFTPTYLVLVGDICQIESIEFGNWFTIAYSYIRNKKSKFILDIQHRTKSSKLADLWEEVRRNGKSIEELLSVGHFIRTLDESIFEYQNDDSIILCLNYDGLYGINNINLLLQARNPNPPIEWESHVYKIGDPVLFKLTNRFKDDLYSNLKGTIKGIKIVDENEIDFHIEIDKWLIESELNSPELKIVSTDTINNKTVISFNVKKEDSLDERTTEESMVPFDVSYCISIHKAQGLEYDNVKIVIANAMEEMVNFNVFYTAITRAKENLTIYWSIDTQKYILNHLCLPEKSEDYSVLLSKFKDLQ